MKFDGLIGGSYQSQSPLADGERTTNWYPEKLQSSGATSQTALYPTPGVVALAAAGVGNGRAHYFMSGREFAVIGAKFYEADASGVLTDRGDVALDSNPATISGNGDGGNQFFITSGTNGYCYDLATNVLTQVVAMNGKCTMGDYMDGRFLVLDAATSTLYISATFDGQTWTPGSEFAQRSLAPDPWKALKVVGRLIWLFGELTSEAWFDSGASFPFAAHPSGLITYGIKAPFSATIIGNDVIWLGATQSGRACVVKVTGMTPEVLSNYPLESAIEGYRGVSAAVGDAYSDMGHTFYLLGFDLADATWAWDAETRLWHERGTWIAEEARFVVWRPRFYARAFNQHRMLDASGGSLYRMGTDLVRDVDGRNIRRVRRAPAIQDENKRVFYAELELDLETGLASIDPTTADFTVTTPVPPTAQFTDASSGDVSSWFWTFGDGNTSSAQNPTNAYAAAGAYVVTLNAMGANGTAVASGTLTIMAIDQPGVLVKVVAPSASVPSSDPQVMLRLSNDGGKTWISEQWRSAGKLGEYGKRVRWTRLGAARRRVFEVSTTDATPCGFLAPSYARCQGGRSR